MQESQERIVMDCRGIRQDWAVLLSCMQECIIRYEAHGKKKGRLIKIESHWTPSVDHATMHKAFTAFILL